MRTDIQSDRTTDTSSDNKGRYKAKRSRVANQQSFFWCRALNYAGHSVTLVILYRIVLALHPAAALHIPCCIWTVCEV